jgi:hypothetical protein
MAACGSSKPKHASASNSPPARHRGWAYREIDRYLTSIIRELHEANYCAIGSRMWKALR